MNHSISIEQSFRLSAISFFPVRTGDSAGDHKPPVPGKGCSQASCFCLALPGLQAPAPNTVTGSNSRTPKKGYRCNPAAHDLYTNDDAPGYPSFPTMLLKGSIEKDGNPEKAKKLLQRTGNPHPRCKGRELPIREQSNTACKAAVPALQVARSEYKELRRVLCTNSPAKGQAIV